MPTVTCWQLECLYNVDGKCRAADIEFDPEEGCLTVEMRDGDDDDGDVDWDGGGMHLLTDED
jgi:hypothetical protein